MSDTIPPADSTPPAGPGPTPPPPPGPPAYSQPPAAGGVKQTLSLTSFIVGIAGFLFSAAPFINFFAFVAGIVAVILGFRGRKNEPQAPSWMSLVGIITGFVAIGLSLIFGAIYLFSVIWPLLFIPSYTY